MILVTGAAGFIGYHVSNALLAQGRAVVGIDNLNDYYDPALKQARLDRLEAQPGFQFLRADIADREAMLSLAKTFPDVTGIIHLAAQAGVRHSLIDPYSYVRSNVEGQLIMLELARRMDGLKHMVYASSSSVYGANEKQPFSIEDPVDTPLSLYAATKRSGELMAYTYAHLYGIPLTGLRFFTVYGPWGRPDMAAYIFASKIMAGEPITVFNNGDMRRDFTFIDDIVDGVIRCLETPPVETPPQRVYNIGNNRSEDLMRFISLIEDSLGMKADMRFDVMQPGDVQETYADIDAIREDLGFNPSTPIDVGIPAFIEWFRSYNQR
ncbi:NAD-dependent epimerase/dehydratase family protein [Alphaproteobacteria bacterium HT1-32]|nr:NAD-dependent epimerase/dehydratase family protein [Alphaproteobacteria bacterium HT1-32]